MLFQTINKKFAVLSLVKSLVAPLLLFWFGAIAVSAQTQTSEQPATLQTTEEVKIVAAPVMQAYRGVKIGMSADEVTDKLGKPKVSDATGFLYTLSDNESVQIVLDSDKTVRVISMMYSEGEQAPKYEDVFGKEVKVNNQPDGSIYNMKQYPEAGYVVVYSRSAGDNPMTVVTIQEMP